VCCVCERDISTDGSILLYIKQLDGTLSKLQVDPSDSIEAIKLDIMGRSRDVAASQVVLQYRGFGLREDFTIQEHGITSNQELTVQWAEEKDEENAAENGTHSSGIQHGAHTIRQALLNQVCAEYVLTSNGKSFTRRT